MDAKIIVYGFCLVAIICGASFWSYTMGIDDAQKDVFSARQQLAVIEDSMKQAKGWLKARKEAAALISAASIIEKENEALRNEIASIRGQRRDVAKVYTSSIERARTEFVGTTLPEVSLASGTRFRNAKIQSLDSEITVIHHSEGVSKVPTADLPPEIQDRLRYGFNPGGLGSQSKEKKDTSSTTTASDRAMRLGLSSAPVASPTTEDRAAPAISAPQTPAEAVGQRESLGRVFIPGKGWQRMGAGGSVAAPQLSSSTTFGSRNPESVSKVKTRAEMNQQNGRQP
jgi:hypothetical protein